MLSLTLPLVPWRTGAWSHTGQLYIVPSCHGDIVAGLCRERLLLVDPDNSPAASKQLVALVVGHELAHQWFGNLVSGRARLSSDSHVTRQLFKLCHMTTR